MRLGLGVLLAGLLLAGCKEKCEEMPMSAQQSLVPEVALAVQNTVSAAGGKVCKRGTSGVAVFSGQMAAAYEALDAQMEKTGWSRSSQDQAPKNELFTAQYKPRRQSSLSIFVEILTNKSCDYGDVCMRFTQNGVPTDAELRGPENVAR